MSDNYTLYCRMQCSYNCVHAWLPATYRIKINMVTHHACMPYGCIKAKASYIYIAGMLYHYHNNTSYTIAEDS